MSNRLFRWGARVLPVMLALIAVLFAALSIFLWIQLQKEYREMKSVRLDPLGTHASDFPADAPASADTSLPTVLFFGDSRARAWSAPRIDGGRFCNRGIDGQTTAQALGRMGDALAQLKPRVVVLECGINDLTAIGVFPERKQEIIASCESNLKKMVSLARDNNAQVIVVTIFPTGSVSIARRPFWSEDIADAVAVVNATLRSCTGDGIRVLNADDVLCDGKRVKREFYVDTLHLSPQGYGQINHALAPLLKTSAP